MFTATINSEGIGYLDGSTVDISENVQLVSTLPLDLTLWHRRLGHLNHDSIKTMLKHNLVTGLTMDSLAKPDPICEPCLAGKMHANPFPSSDNRAIEVLELIHSDLHHLDITSHGGYNYWITFIDDCSKFKAAVPLKRKSDAFDAFKQFKVYAENQTGKKIKKFRCDKGGEYMSNEFIGFLTLVELRNSILFVTDHSRMEWLSVQIEPWQKGLQQCLKNQVCPKGIRLSVWLHLFMCLIVVLQLL